MNGIDRPLELAHGPAWTNRVGLAPMTNQQSNADGTLSDNEARWLSLRAGGGFAVVMTCAAHVSQAGQAFPGQLGVWGDHQLAGLTRLASIIRDGGNVSIVQLHHGGRRASTTLTGLPVVAPFDDHDTDAQVLTTRQIEELIDSFLAAAQRAERAGFDGVELHGAHDFLIGQFLDVGNNRQDRFGGPLENRERFLFDVLERIRRETGSNFQIGLRLDPERVGIPLAEARSVAERAMSSGLIDFLDLSMKDTFKLPHDAEQSNKLLLQHFTELARGDVRLGVAGNISSGADVLRSLELGADFVLIGSAAVLHHDFATHVLEDSSFEATATPVTAEYLHDQGVSDTFVEYLAEGWKDFVSPATATTRSGITV